MSRVLLVTIILIGRTGTEVVCCETARGLRRRGHEVAIYAQQDGPTADGLRAEGFHVTTDLATLTSTPDVIQANQTYPLLEAIGRFPAVPAISVCHDATVWFSEPIDLPSIRRHVAVDFASRDRIANRFPHLGERIAILNNAVDLERFQPRAALPPRPRRALVLAKQTNCLAAIRAACRQRGIPVETVGPAVTEEVSDLASRLREHDLVFASARGALEAAAVGCAVIAVDGRGLAGLVTSRNVSWWRENNFGMRVLTRPLRPELIVAEIDRYDAADARLACEFIRRHASLELALDRLEGLHRDVIAESAGATVEREALPLLMGRACRALASAQQEQTEADFETFARAREAELRAEFRERLGAREAELQAEFQRRFAAQEAARDAQLRDRLAAAQAELRASLEGRLRAKEAEFQAYVDWVAPRNLARRILRKLRRVLSGG
jgi:glycosyl transferase family 4